MRTLAGLEPEHGVDVAAGKKIFADNCAACHGDDGKGNIEMGAPNLTTKIWHYGSDMKDLIYTITYARNSVDAGVGPAPRSGDDQVARGLCSQSGRRYVSGKTLAEIADDGPLYAAAKKVYPPKSLGDLSPHQMDRVVDRPRRLLHPALHALGSGAERAEPGGPRRYRPFRASTSSSSSSGRRKCTTSPAC